MAARLTQDDWCNAPQPGNWKNACMRAPGHGGPHAVRKSYQLYEAWTWEGESYPVRRTSAAQFPDLWSPAEEIGAVAAPRSTPLDNADETAEPPKEK